jgi:hypothetical protein
MPAASATISPERKAKPESPRNSKFNTKEEMDAMANL